MSKPDTTQELREWLAEYATSNQGDSYYVVTPDDVRNYEIVELQALITANTNAEIAKVLKTILKSYPKKNRTMNDTSKLTRADIDRMITELKERDDE